MNVIIAFTGAGISKASGIPTFDEMGDLRTKLDRDFARRNKEEFNDIMDTLKRTCGEAKPNDAHIVLAENNIPVITMNIDGLHRYALRKLGKSENSVIEVHGNIFDNNVVLYGDQAPNYSKAYSKVRKLRKSDILLIIGTSYYTNIASILKELAEKIGVKVIEINEDAEHKVREYIDKYKDTIEDLKKLENREELY